MIRPVRLEDAARIATIYAPFCEETTVSFETLAPTPEEIARRIERVTARYPWLVWTPDGEVTGYAYASPHRERAAYQWSVDVAIYLDAAHRGRGGGRLLYTELFRQLRERGYYSAYAGIALPNQASIGLHEAMGFTLVGVYHKVGYKMGAWHDVAWYELELQNKGGEPIPIDRFNG